MAKVIGFSGAHSTGKSTTLKAIQDLNLAYVKVDTFQASRSVQATMNLPLEVITSDIDLMISFQDAILEAKIENDNKLILENSNITYCVDRTPADMYAYAKIWLENSDYALSNKYTEWFFKYAQKCQAAMHLYSVIAYFPINPAIPFVEDPKRATLETRNKHDLLCQQFSWKHARNWCLVSTTSIGNRVGQIERFAYMLNSKCPSRL